ncbi:MAG: four helix bundle protein [Bacteroidales bacterium]|nr:four helix bundle protein [Bacteroidales bacterium]
MSEPSGSILYSKSKAFALRIVNLCKFLEQEKKEYILSRQVKRSGTSIGANLAEAKYGQSVPDFINRLSIAQKEANETRYWLELLYEAKYIESELAYTSLMNDLEEIQKMLTSSIKTNKKKGKGGSSETHNS